MCDLLQNFVGPVRSLFILPRLPRAPRWALHMSGCDFRRKAHFQNHHPECGPAPVRD